MLFPRQLDAGGTNKDGPKSPKMQAERPVNRQTNLRVRHPNWTWTCVQDWSEHALQTLVSRRSGGYYGGSLGTSLCASRRFENQHPDASKQTPVQRLNREGVEA